MARFIRHVACEKCGSSDANGIYDDDSSFCFSCGATNRAKKAAWIPSEEDVENTHTLPDDLSTDFPQEVVEFLKPTGITIPELIQNDYTYSRKSRHGLIRLLENGCYESRNVDRSYRGPKTLFLGGSKQLVNGLVVCRSGQPPLARRLHRDQAQFVHDNWGREEPYRSVRRPDASAEEASGGVQRSSEGPGASQEENQEAALSDDQRRVGPRACCLVEDSLSAIKVSRVIDSIPLFGSSINNDKLVRILKGYDRVYVWLDENKFTTAQSIAVRCQLLGVDAKVIYSQLDPKYCNAEEFIK